MDPPRYKDGACTLCAAAHRAAVAEARVEYDRERYRKADYESLRAAMRKRVYGIMPDQTPRLLDAQGGHCALCPATAGRRGGVLHVDHAHHGAKRVRGLVCNACNLMLSHIERDPAAFASPLVLAYLRGPWADDVETLIEWYALGGPRALIRP